MTPAEARREAMRRDRDALELLAWALAPRWCARVVAASSLIARQHADLTAQAVAAWLIEGLPSDLLTAGREQGRAADG